MGREKEGIRHLREALRLAPDFASAHFNVGSALQSRGDHEEAIGHYRRALRAEPEASAIRDRLDEALAQVMSDE